jgi:hypothetical protein
MTTAPQRLKVYEILEGYEVLAAALRRRDNGPTPAEIQTFVKNSGDDPSEEMQEFLLLLKSLNKMAEGPELRAARRKARAQLKELTESYQRTCVRFSDKPQSVDSGIGSQAEFGAIGKVMLAWSWAWGEGEALRGPTPSGAGRDRSRRLARHISPSRFKLSAKTRSQIRR